MGPRLEPPSLRAAREGQRGLRCPAEAWAARPFRFCLQRRAMLLKPVCARKAFLWGSAKDLCSGTRALLGECFLWSPPTRLGLALTMYVFYPSTLGPCGSHQAPVTTLGPLPRSSLPSLFSAGERLPGPLVLSPPRAPAPWEGASGLQTPVWLPGGLAHKAPLLHAASLSNSISVTVFIRISLILWGHKPISSGAKGMPYLKERGVGAP